MLSAPFSVLGLLCLLNKLICILIDLTILSAEKRANDARSRIRPSHSLNLIML